MLCYCRYGDLYTEKNVAISGIHTHSGPGGYLQYIVYIVTSLGFVRQSFDAVVDGIEQSIIQAHDNIKSGSLYVNKGNGILSGTGCSSFTQKRIKKKKAIAGKGLLFYFSVCKYVHHMLLPIYVILID